MPTRKRSTVWLHFDRVEGNKGKCKYCSSRLSCAGGSTGNLTRHINNKHPSVLLQLEREMRYIDINKSSNSLVGEPMGDPDHPIQVEEDLIADGESGVAESTEVKKLIFSMPTRKRSTVWLHFDRVEGNKGKCKYCSSRLSCAGGSTGNLTRHIKSKHPDIYNSTTSLVGQSMDPDHPIQVQVDLIADGESGVAESMEVKKRKRKIDNNHVDMDNNPDLQFFKSLIPYMADFSAIQKLRIRSKIQQIILTEHVMCSINNIDRA